MCIKFSPDRDKMAVDTDDTEDEGIPRITLAEMLEDLDLAEGQGDVAGVVGAETSSMSN